VHRETLRVVVDARQVVVDEVRAAAAYARPLLADEADAERLFRLVREDPALAAYGGVVANGEWALDLDAQLLGRLAGEGALRVVAGGRALAAVREGWGGDNLWAYFVSGSGGALQELLLALRYEADADGMEGVHLWAPDGHPAEEDFSATGYDSEAEPFRLSYFALRL